MLAFPEMIKSLTPVKDIFKKGSSFRKQLLEKAGDLIAIIISIYLALSIEGWSEKRHEHQRLMKYYENLINEIAEDTASLNTAIENAEYHISRADDHIRMLKSYRSDRVDSISDLLGTMTSSSIFYTSSMITFKSMQMGGDIKLIENLALRDSLIKLDERYLNVRLQEDLYVEHVKDEVLSMLKKNFDLIDGKAIHADIFTRPEYRNLVVFFQSLNRVRLDAYEEALTKAVNTMEMLRDELE